MLKLKDKNAFTIIELLIVIVVIGILSSLVLSTVSGANEDAQNARTLSAIKAYKTAFTAYLAENGDYPAAYPSGNKIGLWCLGDDYVDTTGNGKGNCRHSVTGPYIHEENDLINDSIAPYLSNDLPEFNYSGQDFNPSYNFVGAYYSYDPSITVDGVVSPAYIKFHLKGSGLDCGVSGAIELTSSGTWPAHQTSTTGYTKTNSEITVCRVRLPIPSNI